MDNTKELEKAYRALRGLYHYATQNKLPPQHVLNYHAPTIAAAIRFVDEDALDGSEYFDGKSVDVLHQALRSAIRS